MGKILAYFSRSSDYFRTIFFGVKTTLSKSPFYEFLARNILKSRRLFICYYFDILTSQNQYKKVILKVKIYTKTRYY
jgi:hypothetical protein